MNVMLLAAGEGKRLRPYTLIKPKPAIPFLNVPLASYPLAFLEDMKVDRLIVNTFHLPTKIVDLFLNMNHGARRLYFSHEINQILDTGGGLGVAREYFQNHGDLIMMNADEVILPLKKDILAAAFEQHQKNQALCTLLTMQHPDVGTKFGGVWLDPKNNVRGFGKTPPNADCIKAEHFIGVQILSEKIFDYLPNGSPANILYDAVTKAIQDGHVVQRYNVDCHWYETGNPQDFLQASAAALKILSGTEQSYAKTYLQGALKRFSKETPILDIQSNCTLLKTASTLIDPTVSMTGVVVLGEKSTVGKNSTLKNVIVGDHVHIALGTTAEDEIFLEGNSL